MKNIHIGYLVEKDGVIRTKIVYLEDNFGLNDLYKHVGCDMLDAVRLPEDIDIWIDDEGLMKPDNEVLNYSVNFEGDIVDIQLAGKALFLSYNSSSGETIGLNKKQVKWIRDNVKITPYGVIK